MDRFHKINLLFCDAVLTPGHSHWRRPSARSSWKFEFSPQIVSALSKLSQADILDDYVAVEV